MSFVSTKPIWVSAESVLEGAVTGEASFASGFGGEILCVFVDIFWLTTADVFSTSPVFS
jgi:hypothetical protein